MKNQPPLVFFAIDALITKSLSQDRSQMSMHNKICMGESTFIWKLDILAYELYEYICPEQPMKNNKKII